jgi:hypothetical protein
LYAHGNMVRGNVVWTEGGKERKRRFRRCPVVMRKMVT